jgi:hypothetical protein
MNIENKGAILLALAVWLGIFGARPASAQLPSAMEALRRPVPESELQKFSSDMITLMRVISSMNVSHPDMQSRMAQAQQELANLTPEQLTAMANAYDRPGLSQVVEHLRSRVPETGVTPTLAVAARPPRETAPPIAEYPISPSTTTLVTANYDTCVPGTSSSYNSVGPPIPSAPSEEYDRFDAIRIAKLAQVVLDYACDIIVDVFGEGTNAVACIPAGIADLVLVGLEEGLATDTYCDPYVLAAENDATYSNTFAIFNNLASTRNEIDSGIAAIDSQLSSVNSNLTNTGLVLTSNILQAQADLDTRLNKVDADVTAGTTQVDANIATLQALAIRIEIERSLALGITVGLFETPQAQGGYLELVGSTVQTVVNGLAAAGQRVGNAQRFLNLGNAEFTAKQYKAAYHDYFLAYQAAVR